MSHHSSPAHEVAEFDEPDRPTLARHPCPRLAETAWLLSDRVIDLKNHMAFLARRAADSIGMPVVHQYERMIEGIACELGGTICDLDRACLDLRIAGEWKTSEAVLKRTATHGTAVQP